jgi:hypothetical protein
MELAVVDDIGSDHFPIFFRLCLKERAGERKVAPSASIPVEAEASEELREGRAEKREENAN